MSSSPASPQTLKPSNDSAVETRKTSKTMNIKVVFLDNSSHVFQIASKAVAQQLFDKVCKYLNLLEVDYFGLEYTDDKNTKYWLDALKPVCRQTSLSLSNLSMNFCVKFYTPDPVQLEDEYTRYLFSLQIKWDLAAGLLQCNDNTAALMVSYIIQADRGDCDDEESENLFLISNKFVPYQDAELQKKILENHRRLVGQTPAEADLNLLETARRCELYGIRMTSAKDHEGVPLNLAVAHLGVLVFQNFTKINTFSWAKIRKLSFKRKKFLIKLHPEGYGYYKDTVEFFFEGRNECKNFWKKCIENHTFFRCTDAKAGMRQKPKIFSRGSSFRYSGRTQKQVSDFVRENYIKRQPFQRSTSLRTTPSSPSKTVGCSVSAQPLLPITTSVSCGSMADAVQGSSPKNQMSASEPTTPYVIQDTKSLTNRDMGEEEPVTEEKQTQASSGLVSPDFDCDQETLQSPDIFSQDTDDNISHDSYHVLEKEVCKIDDTEKTRNDYSLNKEKNESASVGSVLCHNDSRDIHNTLDGIYSVCKKGDPENNKVVSNQSPSGGEISYALRMCHSSELSTKETHVTKKSRRPRVRVEVDHQRPDQTSPTLYARANCFSKIDTHDERGSPKSHYQTVDFVLVNQLPAIGSFSWKDDSVELKSPDKVKLEILRQRLLENSRSFWQNNSHFADFSRSKCLDDSSSMCGAKRTSSESIITVLEQPSLTLDENSGTSHSFPHSSQTAENVNAEFKESVIVPVNHSNFSKKRMHFGRSEQTERQETNEAEKTYLATEVTHKKLSESVPNKQVAAGITKPSSSGTVCDTEYYMPFQRVLKEDHEYELVDPSNQYTYSSYKFCQIELPPQSSYFELNQKISDPANLSLQQ